MGWFGVCFECVLASWLGASGMSQTLAKDQQDDLSESLSSHGDGTVRFHEQREGTQVRDGFFSRYRLG